MADFKSYQQHENLNRLTNIVAIGGGHGLGRVMSALSFMKERLTAIVTTTDNGGSTGRIRMEHGGIAWGDLRNCLNQIITEPSTASALFEYPRQSHVKSTGRYANSPNRSRQSHSGIITREILYYPNVRATGTSCCGIKRR